MRTTDEIAKQRQRVGQALARIEAERERLTGQLAELETTERVLARYSKGARVKRTGSATEPATKVTVPRSSGRRRTAAKESAGSPRTSPTLGDRVLALATGKGTSAKVGCHSCMMCIGEIDAQGIGG